MNNRVQFSDRRSNPAVGGVTVAALGEGCCARKRLRRPATRRCEWGMWLIAVFLCSAFASGDVSAAGKTGAKTRKAEKAPVAGSPTFRRLPDRTTHIWVSVSRKVPVKVTQSKSRVEVELVGARTGVRNSRLPLVTSSFDTPVSRVQLVRRKGSAVLVLRLRSESTVSHSTNDGPGGSMILEVVVPPSKQQFGTMAARKAASLDVPREGADSVKENSSSAAASDRNADSRADSDRDTDGFIPSSPDDTTPEPTDESTDAPQDSESRISVELGLDTGYSLPFGTVDGSDGGGLHRLSSGAVPIAFRGGARINNSFIGLYVQYGIAQLGSELERPCGDSCTQSLIRVGGAYQFHFGSYDLLDPWVGAGIGLEIHSTSAEGPGGSASVSFYGVELAFEGGLDFRLAEAFLLGPMARVTVANYFLASVDGTAFDDTYTFDGFPIHGWVTFGARATLLFDVSGN